MSYTSVETEDLHELSVSRIICFYLLVYIDSLFRLKERINKISCNGLMVKGVHYLKYDLGSSYVKHVVVRTLSFLYN